MEMQIGSFIGSSNSRSAQGSRHQHMHAYQSTFGELRIYMFVDQILHMFLADCKVRLSALYHMHHLDASKKSQQAEWQAKMLSTIM